MHSLVSIIGVVLTGKDNWSEWYRKLKNTLIFNDFWEGVYIGDTKPVQPTDAKELVVWKKKNCKAYALIAASINEEVNRHISSIDDAWSALKKLRELYDSHSELELTQLQLKLFNLTLKGNDPMMLFSKIRAIMHDIKATGATIDIALAAAIKALYPTFSTYLESLQASGQLKALTFDALANKIVEREKAFGKKVCDPTPDTLCLA